MRAVDIGKGWRIADTDLAIFLKAPRPRRAGRRSGRTALPPTVSRAATADPPGPAFAGLGGVRRSPAVGAPQVSEVIRM